MQKKLKPSILSSAAKAEILASVLHMVEETPRVWKALPKRLQRIVRRTQMDCGIWHEDLKKKDYKLIRKWFDGFHAPNS
jgi:hypothetical protein